MDKNNIQNYLYLNIILFLVICVSSRNITSKTLDAKKIHTKIIFKKISRKKLDSPNNFVFGKKKSPLFWSKEYDYFFNNFLKENIYTDIFF